ncbi:hypothetical protein O1611_g9712 [Lasiodiplodia mahajangana]|uniref:Uncharacterized protein n=1 Tax=Lasiodiplodia mahajangana TaxID=1108764 RepID=A0ACC2J6A7_9PEZI|nr:hypothetical protein O1611_g9712 [Lasiodiplodia mahajangana]
MLLETNLYNPFNDHRTHVSFRACTVRSAISEAPGFIEVLPRHDDNRAASSLEKRSVELEALPWGSTTLKTDETSISSAFTDLASFLVENRNLPTIFASRRDVRIGFYVGPGIDLGSVADIVNAFAHTTGPFQARRAVHWCGAPSGSDDSRSFGLILDINGDISAIQSALATWATGHCLQDDNGDKMACSAAQAHAITFRPNLGMDVGPWHNDAGSAKQS